MCLEIVYLIYIYKKDLALKLKQAWILKEFIVAYSKWSG